MGNRIDRNGYIPAGIISVVVPCVVFVRGEEVRNREQKAKDEELKNEQRKMNRRCWDG